ncbi:Uma2 family endonuclease [Thiofilum flexile]|uniref:Uma2 family endonuclease n=1 Tax=Thiofilum flexile TaxID=125627 RepID=UPI000365489A|nr:Uma2 family endonuclease [Thiofilum flexile]
MTSNTQALSQTDNVLPVEEYLAGEQTSEIRHEYVDGKVYAMAGASMNHNRIANNLVRHLGNQLANQPCEVFSSDMMLKTGKNRYRYPDVMVVCYHTDQNTTSTDNPVLLVEVLSKGTRQTDRKEKLLEYLQLPSLQEYILIEQDSVEVEVLRRSQGWKPEYYYWEDSIHLESVNITLTVQALYERVVNNDTLSLLEAQDPAKA